MERGIDSSSYPPTVRTFFYGLLIHLRRQRHDSKIGEYIQREQLPCFRRINRRRKWRTRQNCIGLGKSVATDVSGHPLFVNHPEGRQRLAVVGMASNRRCYQNSRVEVRPHIPEASLVRSSRTMSTTLSQSKPRGALPR